MTRTVNVFAMVFVACAASEPPPRVVGPKASATPLAEDAGAPASLDLGTLATPTESLAARPKYVRAHDERGALDYAPSIVELGFGTDVVIGKMGRDLDRDFLFCDVKASRAFEAEAYIVETHGARFSRASSATAHSFSLPLWSMIRGDAITITLVERGHDESNVVFHGAFDGTLPLVASSGEETVSCAGVARDVVAHEVKTALAGVDELFARETQELEVSLAVADPFETPTLRALDDVRSRVAAFVGWSHPLVAPLDARVESAASSWRAARTALFQSEYAKASGSALTGDKVLVAAHGALCEATTRYKPLGVGPLLTSAITLGREGVPSYPGCGFALDLTNQSSADVRGETVLDTLRVVTEHAAYAMEVERGSLHEPASNALGIKPGTTSSYRVFARVDPRTLAGDHVLAIAKDRALFRVR